MPYDNTKSVGLAAASVTFADLSGKKAVVSIPNAPVGTTGAMVDAFAQAVGDASNAGISAYSFSAKTRVPDADLLVYDEAFSASDVKAVMIFQNSSLEIRRISVPAPDASLFYPGYKQLKSVVDSTAVAAIVNAFKAIVNASGDDYEYIRGFREGFSEAAAPNYTVTEPGDASSPPQLPASEPI